MKCLFFPVNRLNVLLISFYLSELVTQKSYCIFRRQLCCFSLLIIFFLWKLEASNKLIDNFSCLTFYVAEKMVAGLSCVSWEKVDVSFHSIKLRFAAHSVIQVSHHSPFFNLVITYSWCTSLLMTIRHWQWLEDDKSPLNNKRAVDRIFFFYSGKLTNQRLVLLLYKGLWLPLTNKK